MRQSFDSAAFMAGSEATRHLWEARKVGQATQNLISVSVPRSDATFYFYPSIDTIRGFARLSATEAIAFLEST